MVFLKEFFEKVDFEKNQQTKKKHAKLPSRQRVKHYNNNDGHDNIIFLAFFYSKAQKLKQILENRVGLNEMHLPIRQCELLILALLYIFTC